MSYLDLRTRQALQAKPMRRRLLAEGAGFRADSRPCSDGGFSDACSAIVAKERNVYSMCEMVWGESEGGTGQSGRNRLLADERGEALRPLLLICVSSRLPSAFGSPLRWAYIY
ncbi:polyketide synthetase PksP [Aspergillus luchuensis]|uniref:Polyketide synthetase PksP n=1 Tax=Aspergillus kawachii TaxID=1069201 RepID=A0A146FUZ5_ASPKA|nr:polyketide synthetase PksP [Aspergillus luchuensis]